MPDLPTLHVHCNAPIGPLHLQMDFAAGSPWTVVFGPSGSGKSSLLRLVAGLWTPPDSDVTLGGDNLNRLPAHKRRIALVAQKPALFPHWNARANVAFALGNPFGYNLHNGSKAWEFAEQLLDRFQASHVALQKPAELSGGETQRVALARAVASKPRLLLLDEVFTGLGAALVQSLHSELRRWQSETATPILTVTHDLVEAWRADEVIRMDKGKITAQGPPGIVLKHERGTLLHELQRP